MAKGALSVVGWRGRTALAVIVIAVALHPPGSRAADRGALPLGCGYEGPLGHLDVVDLDQAAKEKAARATLSETERRILSMNDYASMVMGKAAELNPGFPGTAHVRSMAISTEPDRRQADVEVTLEWRSGDADDIVGRAVIGVTKCGEGRGRLTPISVEFSPQDRGPESSPIGTRPASAIGFSRPGAPWAEP
jgi:hypothetical protein